MRMKKRRNRIKTTIDKPKNWREKKREENETKASKKDNSIVWTEPKITMSEMNAS